MLSVLNLNLWNTNPPLAERMGILADYVRKQAPDVVLLQEVVFAGSSNQALDVLDSDYRVHAVLTEAFDDGGEGVAIASRRPLRAPVAVALPAGPNEPHRQVAMAIIDDGNVPIACAVTHLAWRPEHTALRCAQAEATVAAMAEYQARHHVEACALGLDANATPDSAPIDILRLGGLVDSLRGPAANRATWSSSNPYVHATRQDPAGRLDYVFTRAISPVSAQIVLDSPPYASDHFGIWAQLG